MPRNASNRIITPGARKERVLLYENPARHRPDGCGNLVEFRDPTTVVAMFGYSLNDRDAPDNSGLSVEGLKLELQITVAGCDVDRREESDGGFSTNIPIDFARGIRICVPASTLSAFVSYNPPNLERAWPKVIVDAWAGVGSACQFNGAAMASLTVFVVPNENGVYPFITIPVFSRGVVALADSPGKQAGLTIQQWDAPNNGAVLLSDTFAPVADGLAIPILDTALAIRLTWSGGEGQTPPTVAVRFLLALG